MKKRLLSIWLSVCMVLTLLPGAALAAEPVTIIPLSTSDPAPFTAAVNAPLEIEVLPIYGNPAVDEMSFPEHGFTRPTDGSKTAELYWDSDNNEELSYGETGYDISSTSRSIIYFYATEPGTYTFTATFTYNTTRSDYLITVNVTGTPPASSDATLKASSAVKGQTVTSLGTPGSTLGDETAGSVTITAAQAADTNNTGDYITLFDKNDSNATVKVVKYASGASAENFETDTAYANEAIADGDFFVIKVTAQDGTTVNYYRIHVTVTTAAESNPTKSIAENSLYFRVNGGDTQYSTDNANWTSYTGSFTIEGSSTSDTDATHTVIVQSGTHNITLSDCSIGAATDTGTYVSAALSPFDIRGGTVNLTLTGSNKLYSAHVEKAGLRVASGAALIVTAESTGSLDTRCHKNGTVTDFGNLYGAGAGIGSDREALPGTIAINGGDVRAYSYHGAGIGSGFRAGYGPFDVTITGGTVVAQSGDGNGIGHGNQRAYDLGSAIINGGSVNVSGIGGTLTNGYEDTVQLYTLTLSGVSSATAVTALSATPEIGYTYGTTGMKTDADGKLYVYLPAGKTGASVIAAARTYTNDSFTGNDATLYSGYAVSGTVRAGGITGADVSGLTVYLYDSGDTTFSTPVGSATTNGSGAYTINHVENGSYVARVEGSSGSYAASSSDTITVGDAPVDDADITLTALATKSIAVKAGSHKIAYKVGEALDMANLTITVTRSDDSTYEEPVTADMVDGFNSSAVTASKDLTVTFDGKTATYNISVSRADYSGSAAPAPTLSGKTDTKVSLNAVTVADQSVEYGKNSSNDTPTEWQDGTTFTGLTAGTAYYFFARVKQTDTIEAGGVSPALAVATKANPTAPDAPTIGTGEDKPTSVSITIETAAGNEYYISTSGTADWSGTPSGYFKAAGNGIHKFESLTPATQYYIHVRVAETDDAMPSESAYTAQYALPATPPESVVTVNYMEETMSFGSTYEVSGDPDFLDSGKVVVSGGAVQPGTTYYVRVKAAGGVPASEAVSFTAAARPTTPDAVTAANITKTDTAITIAGTVSTQEYSVDGGTTWKPGIDGSLTFNSLTANHAYSVVTRIPATATTFASASSAALSVTTKASASAAPSSGVTYSVKDGAVTGLGDTYEYSLDGGSTWTTMPVTGVTFTVGNVIQVRTRETDTAMPSLPQTLGTIAALAAAPDYAIDFINEKTAVFVPATVEYNTTSAGAGTWAAGSGETLALTPGTTYYFRAAATDTALAGNVQTLVAPARPSVPDSTVATIAEGSDAVHTKLTLADTYEYILAAASPTASMPGTAGIGSATEVEATDGQHIYVRIKAVANTSFSSDWIDCGLVQPGVNDIILTGVGYDVAAGKLTGTTDNMEYQVADGTWTACTSPDTAGVVFAAGAVKARQKDKTTNEHTVGTIALAAASNAPTLESKTYNNVTLTPMAGYEYSKDGGTTWQDSNLFPGLSSGTAYSFVARIKATAAALPGATSAALSVATNDTSSGGGSGAPSAPGTGAPVIVDGKTENIGTEKKSGDTTTVTVDQSKLGENIGGAATGSSVVVPVNENRTATASLVVKNIEDMAAKGMTLTVQAGNVAYNLDTSAIDTAALASAFSGADMSRVPFDVTIKNSSATVEGETLVLSPVEFTVTATYNGKIVSVDTFSAYIGRVIEITAAQAAKITTAVVVNAGGSIRHVPTNVIEKDGKYYAVINSRTNSTYALIQNEVRFADATGKWYEAAVNEMGSRKIIEGRSAAVFDGEASITRAEFAAILVRALGLPADATSTFADVPVTAWYTGAVATAVQYGLTDGRGNNRFEPGAAITRQEAMLMLRRAGALTEFTGKSSGLDSFTDADSVVSWAQEAAKWNVGSGLIQGADGKLNPTANITRAESAAIILRLLQRAELVDVRSEA